MAVGFTEAYAQEEVSRYISYPGQSPAYMLGRLKIANFRNKTADALGDNFVPRDFHNLLIRFGSPSNLDNFGLLMKTYVAWKKSVKNVKSMHGYDIVSRMYKWTLSIQRPVVGTKTGL